MTNDTIRRKANEMATNHGISRQGFKARVQGQSWTGASLYEVHDSISATPNKNMPEDFH